MCNKTTPAWQIARCSRMDKYLSTLLPLESLRNSIRLTRMDPMKTLCLTHNECWTAPTAASAWCFRGEKYALSTCTFWLSQPSWKTHPLPCCCLRVTMCLFSWCKPWVSSWSVKFSQHTYFQYGKIQEFNTRNQPHKNTLIHERWEGKFGLQGLVRVYGRRRERG